MSTQDLGGGSAAFSQPRLRLLKGGKSTENFKEIHEFQDDLDACVRLFTEIMNQGQWWAIKSTRRNLAITQQVLTHKEEKK